MRLHGGIYSIKHGIYSKIYAIDNRAKELLSSDYPVEDIGELVNNNFLSYKICIKKKNRDAFLDQFI